MTNIRYILLLYRDMVLRRRAMLALIVFSEIAAVLCLFFSYGLFMNTMNDVGKIQEDNYSYSYSIDVSEDIDLKAGLDEFMAYMGDDLKRLDLRMTSLLENGEEISVGAAYYKDTENVISDSGEYPEVMIREDMESYVKDGMLELNGITYKVISKRGEVYAAYIPPFNGKRKMRAV